MILAKRLLYGGEGFQLLSWYLNEERTSITGDSSKKCCIRKFALSCACHRSASVKGSADMPKVRAFSCSDTAKAFGSV